MSVSLSKIAIAPNERLYQAQSIANQVVKSNIFPCYTAEYVESQEGIKKSALKCYSVVYTALEKVISLVKQAYAKVLSMNDHMLEKAFDSLKQKIEQTINPALNAVYPINPINGERHFVGISRHIEKVLGECLFYPLSTAGMEESDEHLSKDDAEPIAARVNHVTESLKKANAHLLNPPEETEFNYQVKTIKSTQINAFATPAGGMVVFSELVRKLHDAIESEKFQTSTVEFPDGSQARVNLEGVTLEDAIAALVGHEMTHIASRHSILSMMARVVNSIFVNVARYCSVAYFKKTDKGYQELKAKPLLNQNEVQELLNKERFYDRLDVIFSKIGDGIKHFTDMLLSRANEHEADTTGIWFAHQAGFNPLGAILLQEVLKNSKSGFLAVLHEKLPFLFSHPCAKDRILSNFAAIQAIAPERLKDRVEWNIDANSLYDVERSNLAVQFARNTQAQMAAAAV